ncbi:MAG: YfhO family protein [Bacteroidota bacterium]|nr:YfhO family protein [Bacteroidota bacterium]
MKPFNIKPFLPHIYVIAGFFVAVFIYFLPLFQGKSIRQSDIIQYQGMAKEIQDNRAKYNEEPFWTNSMFSGMPSTMVSMEQYGNLVKPIHIFTTRIIAYPASIIFVSLLCFYIMLLAFDVPYIIAAIGAVGFSFASFNFIGLEVGHNAKLACMSYMPLVIAGLVFGYRKNIWLGSSLIGIGVALQVVNNHIQITYYLAFIALAYIVVEFISALKEKKMPAFIKNSAFLLIAAVVGLGTHAGYFLSINEYSKFSIRGKTELTPLETNKEAVRSDGLDRDYVFNYSNSISEPFTFLIPNFMGGASSGPVDKNSETTKALRENGVDPQNIRQFTSNVPLYFGEQPFVAGPMYLGAIICLLFVLGLLIVNEPFKWTILACTIFGILMTYGKNLPLLNYFLFDYFPLYNKFRSVTMAVVIPQFCMSILGVLALKRIVESKNKIEFIKPLVIAGGVTGGLCLLTFLMAGAGSYSSPADQMYQLPPWLISALELDRKGMRTGDAFRSFLFILLAIGTIYLLIINKIKELVASIILLLLTTADLWLVDKRFLNNDNFDKKVIENYYAPTEADQRILSDKDPDFRVFNLQDPFNDARTSYFHKSVGGYSPAKLRRYQDLIERVLSNEQQTLLTALKAGDYSFKSTPVLNMLNTKYVIAGESAESVIENPNAFGNAWFISSITKVNNPDEEIKTLSTINPYETAVLDVSKFPINNNTYNVDSASFIKLTKFKPYELTYECQNANEGFAVFSEVFYPIGWSATIDGKPADIKRVNYVLRGLEVPAGKHTIAFVMDNPTYKLGNTIGLACSVLLFAGIFVYGITAFRSKKD